MVAKEELTKYIKVSIISSIILLSIALIYNYYFKKDEVYASAQNDVKISNASQIDIESVISKNTDTEQKEEYVTEETQLEYITKYKQNSELPTGVMQVTQEGREGKQEITRKLTYENGELINEEQVSSKITKASVNKIVEIGSGSSKSTYKVKVGDTVYVTSDRAAIMSEASEESQKLATLEKETKLKVLEIQDCWYKVKGNGINGFIKTESTTYINPNSKEETKNEATNSTKTVQKLDFNMALNKPSGLTLDQFKKVLTDSKDKNNIFKNNAQYFYYIEEQYNINGLFIAAVGIHESNWGTSKIAQNKYNLFGYGAYDSNPYNGAYQFGDYSESIDLIARVFVKYYLNPKGTSIYGGEKATGSYYNGATLSGINKKYATDKNWANGVYKNMEYLYNKL